MTTWHALIAAAALCPFAGCATHDHNATPPRPGSGLEEYRQLTGEATAGVMSALSWLERVSAQPGRCPPKIVSGFANEVEQLQVKSIRVRARGQAIRARGDAYFEAWTGGGEHLSAVPPRPTPERLAQLQESFTKIKLASQEAGETFRPFFNGLRNLRAELEADPGVIETEKARELIRTIRERGLQMLQKLGALEDELHAMRPLIMQLKPVTKH